MSLLTPDSGLLFWMVIVFGIVFVILAKYGFPVITRMVDERKQYIDKSLLAAREANEQLANIKADSEMILAKAHEEQARILNEAVATRERILKEAKTQAQVEGQKLLDDVFVSRKEKIYHIVDHINGCIELGRSLGISHLVA